MDSMADNVDKDIYREDVKAYVKDNRVLTRSSKKLYSLVLGQCTESLRAKINGKEYWKRIDDKSNSVDLLNIIKEITFKVDTGKSIYMTTCEVKWETANMRRNMSGHT